MLELAASNGIDSTAFEPSGKAQGLSSLYGPGKLYARGLMPLSAVYEVGTVALLYADRPIGVVALFAYIGATLC